MPSKDKWRYFSETKGQWTKTWITLQQLDKLYTEKKVHDQTPCVNRAMLPHGRRSNGIEYRTIARINIKFKPEPDAFLASRKDSVITVLSGPNNCGKTLLLKQLYSEAGRGAYMVSCNRFSHVDVLNTRPFEPLQYSNYYDSFVQNWYTSRQNTEDSEYKLEQAITGLTNSQRESLFSICSELLGARFSLKRTQTDNEFSPFYVDMDGQNLRYGSTGTRLLLTLFGTILNDRFNVLLIDEPEIGLSPRIQSAVTRLLYDPDNQKQYWPHRNICSLQPIPTFFWIDM